MLAEIGGMGLRAKARQGLPAASRNRGRGMEQVPLEPSEGPPMLRLLTSGPQNRF